VELVEYAGSKTIYGFRGEIMGPLSGSSVDTVAKTGAPL
jgi:urease beta subunit